MLAGITMTAQDAVIISGSVSFVLAFDRKAGRSQI